MSRAQGSFVFGLLLSPTLLCGLLLPCVSAQELNWRRTGAQISVPTQHLAPHLQTPIRAGSNSTAQQTTIVDPQVAPTRLTTVPANEPRRLPQDLAVRPVQSAEEIPAPSEQGSIAPGAQRSSPRTSPTPTPFDDHFPEVKPGQKSSPRIIDSQMPPSIMRKPTQPRTARMQEHLPAPQQYQPEILPTPGEIESPEYLQETIPGEMIGGCADCETDDCGPECYQHGHQHPHLYWLRHSIRTTLQCAAGGCDPCDHGPFGCDPTPMCDWHWANDLTMNIGVQGMKSPIDRGSAGHFGFHEGINWGLPFWDAVGIGAQVGFSALQTSLDETTSTVNDRQQYFITGGLFRRQLAAWGWQYGVVYDHLADNYIDQVRLGQIRGELGYTYYGHELGVWFAYNAQNYRPDLPRIPGLTNYQTMDVTALYYRLRMYNGGEGRVWAGLNDNSDGMFGGDFRAPLNEGLALQASFNYLSAGEQATSFDNEGWNVGLSLVFYPGMSSSQAGRSRYRPLLNVADNGTMMQRGN